MHPAGIEPATTP